MGRNGQYGENISSLGQSDGSSIYQYVALRPSQTNAFTSKAERMDSWTLSILLFFEQQQDKINSVSRWLNLEQLRHRSDGIRPKFQNGLVWRGFATSFKRP